MPEESTTPTASPPEETIGKWFYASEGKRLGPVDEGAMRVLIEQGKVDRTTSVWSEGSPDWMPLEKTTLVQYVAGPPPLVGADISNTIAWLIAIAPLIGGIIELVVAETAKVGGGETWFITLGLNVGLAYWDSYRLNRAGHKDLSGWFVWLVPVYLWKRASMLKQSRACFWVWIGCFIFSSIALGAQGDPISEDELAQLRKCEIVYATDAGLTTTGLNFEKLMSAPLVVHGDPTVTRMDSEICLSLDSPNGNDLAIFFVWDQQQKTLATTKVEIDGKEIVEPSLVMLTLANLISE